jgi:hypothetical protein
VVASLLLVLVVGKEHGCIAAATIVAAGTAIVFAIVGIAGNCPNTAVVEVGAADPRVGYTPYDTLEEHH